MATSMNRKKNTQRWGGRRHASREYHEKESNGTRCEPREKHKKEGNGNQSLLSQGKQI